MSSDLEKKARWWLDAVGADKERELEGRKRWLLLVLERERELSTEI